MRHRSRLRPAATTRGPHFGTMTGDLLAFADWLSDYQFTHVAGESTGVYWQPIGNLLEGHVELLLDNARHVKQVPGRKTDVKYCEWRLISSVTACSKQRLRPFQHAHGHLDSTPGVGRRTAKTLVAEIGLDMTRFPTAAHLASWAGMCPGNNESAGKRKSGKTRKGDAWLRTALIEVAHASSHTRNAYLRALYHYLVTRRGKRKPSSPWATLSSPSPTAF
jgi:transposase